MILCHTSITLIRSFVYLAMLASLCLALTGCEQAPPPEFRMNSVEYLKQERLQLSDGKHFDSKYKRQIGNLVTALFGTPDDPKFPFLIGEDDPAHEIISLEQLRWAAGPVSSDRSGKQSGLYREHCAQCHGISGDGAGPTAAFLNPYPRDFRLGKFKFKSTPLGQPPTDQDLDEIIRNGIPGTAMPSFRLLDSSEVEALVQYVKYLTIRGQFERRLIAAIGEMEPGEPLYDLSLVANKDDENISEEDQEQFEEQMFILVADFLQEEMILDRWYDTEDNITEVPEAQQNYHAEHQDHDALVARGKSIFRGKANCIQCHGDTGMGDGQLNTYDAWVNDWANSPGVNKNEESTFQDFLAAGAFKPRPIRPRNLRVPVYRGGSHAEDVYRRIANGIEGTPMPSSPALSADEIWALVAYVKSLPYEKSATQPSVKPINDQAIR